MRRTDDRGLRSSASCLTDVYGNPWTRSWNTTSACGPYTEHVSEPELTDRFARCPYCGQAHTHDVPRCDGCGAPLGGQL